MYLHVGQDTVVRLDDIIGIFDIDTASISSLTKEFLAESQKNGRVVNVTPELPKSFVVSQPRGKKESENAKVYISQISSTTLLKRTECSKKISRET